MRYTALLAALVLSLAACASRPSVPVSDGSGAPQRCTEALPRTSGLCGQP